MKTSLRSKTVILIILTAAIISIAGIAISRHELRRVVDEAYRNQADGVAHSMAAVLDREKAASLRDAVMEIYAAADEKVDSDAWGTPEFDAYIARFAQIEQSEDFLFLREQLRSIQDVNAVDCLYLATLDPEEKYFIYLVDGAYEDACPPGCLDPLFEENWNVLSDPAAGFPPYITNTEAYGWLVTAGAPVYDADGTVLGYAMVDISMAVVHAQQQYYVLTLTVILLVLTIIVCMCAIWAVDRAIIRPINQLSRAAAHFTAGDRNNCELESLQIVSQDEIQSLADSLRQMTEDIQGYIDNLIATTQELTKTRLEADEMNVLAHRDALTGAGSKLAYDRQAALLAEEIRQGGARFGIVMIDINSLKRLNDTYGHEKGNIAIQKTCSVICEAFPHSPVYRFGGDEFVVVIKDRDYDSIEERLAQFRKLAKESKGEPWEKVNAAIGYALYGVEDSVEDVFRRADHMMYEHKKEMKRQQNR